MRETTRYIITCVLVALLLGIISALGGCATVPKSDLVDMPSVITVNKVVAVSCVKSADIPLFPAKVGNELNGDAVHDASILAAAVLRRDATLGEALAMLQKCAD